MSKKHCRIIYWYVKRNKNSKHCCHCTLHSKLHMETNENSRFSAAFKMIIKLVLWLGSDGKAFQKLGAAAWSAWSPGTSQFVEVTPNISHGSRMLSQLWIGFCLTGPISLCLDSFLWSPYVIGQTIIFSSCSFFLSSSFSSFFSSPNLSGRRLDVYHTSTYGVALVRI